VLAGLPPFLEEAGVDERPATVPFEEPTDAEVAYADKVYHAQVAARLLRGTWATVLPPSRRWTEEILELYYEHRRLPLPPGRLLTNLSPQEVLAYDAAREEDSAAREMTALHEPLVVRILGNPSMEPHGRRLRVYLQDSRGRVRGPFTLPESALLEHPPNRQIIRDFHGTGRVLPLHAGQSDVKRANEDAAQAAAAAARGPRAVLLPDPSLRSAGDERKGAAALQGVGFRLPADAEPAEPTADSPGHATLPRRGPTPGLTIAAAPRPATQARRVDSRKRPRATAAGSADSAAAAPAWEPTDVPVAMPDAPGTAPDAPRAAESECELRSQTSSSAGSQAAPQDADASAAV
jgi:hypothetical protein